MLNFEACDVGDACSPMTPSRLAEMWPAARRRIVTSLCAAGVDRDVAEEAVAEAAARALARGLVVGDTDEFCRWAFVVARNEVWDGTRKSSRVVPIDVIPEQVDHYDMASHVEVRERLRDAVRAISAMSPADRGALLEGMQGTPAPEDRKQAVKHAVRRHRARSRLRDVLGAPAGWLGSPALRRWTWPFSRLSPEGLAAAIALPLLAAAAWSPPPSAASGPAGATDTAATALPATVVDEEPVKRAAEVAAAGPATPSHANVVERPTMRPGTAPVAAPHPRDGGVLAPLPPQPEGTTQVVIDTGRDVDLQAGLDVKRTDDRKPGQSIVDELLPPPGG